MKILKRLENETRLHFIWRGVIADVVLMGHLHHKSVKEFHMRKVYINGSMAGTGEYAVGIRKFSKPSQTLLIFDGNSEIDITINF